MNIDKFNLVVNKIESDGGLGMRIPSNTTRLIYKLAKLLRVKTYIDVGTFVGLTCLWVARAMKENGIKGKIYTMETDKKWYDKAVNFAKEAELDQYINFILGDSRIVLPELKQSLDSIDMVLLDSGSKDLYIRDFENLESKFTNKTLIIAHDIVEPEKVNFKPAFGFKEYIDKRLKYSSIWLQEEYGSLLIQKNKYNS